MYIEYFSVDEILDMQIKGYLHRGFLENKAKTQCWSYRVIKGKTKPIKQYHISNFPKKTSDLIVKKLIEVNKRNNLYTKSSSKEYIEKAMNITYSRLEIVTFLRRGLANINNFIEKYNARELENELSKDIYLHIPNLHPRNVYRWMKQYEMCAIEGIRYKVAERKKGNFKYAKEIKEIVVGILLKKPHLKAKVIYKLLQEFAKEPNYLWELDSSPADVMLEGGRYTILACIDVYSRRVKFLVDKTSNSLGITSLLRACMLEWGIPKIIKTDNGKDYVSQQINIVLNEFNIEHRLANPFQGQEKPHVERVFRRFQHDFVETLPNFIGHNVGERKAIESIKTFDERLFGRKETIEMQASRFQEFCNWWIENQYMNVQHRGLNNKTPSAMLEGHIPNLPNSEQQAKLNLLLEPIAGMRTIVKKGIRVENTNYFNPILAQYVGEQVNVRVDRFDMGKIYVFDKAHNYLCEAINYELLGNSKFEFIKQGKAIQNEVVKQTKEKTRKLIKKAKGKLDYLENIQIDTQEIAEKVLNVKDYVDREELERQSRIEEGKERYKRAKILETKLENQESIDKEDLRWLKVYQETSEYFAKSIVEENEILTID